MKRVVTIQDISCVGKCSLTVALPIISAMGVETAVIPTAVLSTHTMFSNFTFHDLTAEIEPIAAHWQQEGIGFEAIYTGYLGSFEQLNIVSRFFDQFKTPENLIIVDPVMADNGKLYPAFSEAFALEMAKLCGKADIILPNLTEACFMTQSEYHEDYTEEYIADLLQKLAALGAKKAVLTGVSFEPGQTGAVGLEAATGRTFSYSHEKLPVSYHGTGDIFSSALTGALMRDYPVEEAIRIAADYTLETIRATMQSPKSRWYGVDFERTLPLLIHRLEQA